MRPFTLSQTGVGSSDVARVNYLQPNFKIGFGVVVDGTVTYTIQHTFDNPNEIASPVWFDNETVVAETTNQDGSYFFPFQAVRVTVTAGTGTATATFIQGSEN